MIKIGQFYKCKSSEGEVFAMVVGLPPIDGPYIYKLMNIESSNRFYPVGETVEVYNLESFTRMKRPKWKIRKSVASKAAARVGMIVHDEYFDLIYMVVGVHDEFVDGMIMQSDHVSFDVGELMEVTMEDFIHTPIISIPKWKEKK